MDSSCEAEPLRHKIGDMNTPQMIQNLGERRKRAEKEKKDFEKGK